MRDVWTIVLAAGAGRRLAKLTGGVPKQFWRVGAGKTMLEDTLDRLMPLAAPERTLVVVGRDHEPFLEGVSLRNRRVLFQPEDRGTAAGLLLGLLPVLHADPGAVVVVSPADHGVGDVRIFEDGIRRAIRHVRLRRAGVVLFGVEPDGVADGYGWIRPRGGAAHGRIRDVASFVEKPAAAEARRLLREGAVWNTMVLVAGAGSLAAHLSRSLPRLYETLSRAWSPAAGTDQNALREAYAGLEAADFSRDVLGRESDLRVSIWPASMRWSDLGTPERMAEWLAVPETAATSAA